MYDFDIEASPSHASSQVRVTARGELWRWNFGAETASLRFGGRVRHAPRFSLLRLDVRKQSRTSLTFIHDL
jgi:hypothetical protein